MIQFEWDPAKAKINERKHGVAFEEAMKVFNDPYAMFREDFTEKGETRWQVIGIASGLAVLLIVHSVRATEEGHAEVIRIISARAATRKEQALYDENRS